ncbi:MAG: hypothetical protein E7395_07025 [Ruminococcaceae bacterium]|nr:hypothetical protein [Oscillospiraceae bacterium]
MRKLAFLWKVLKMCATLIVFNISGICYNIFISERAPAAEIGLMHLVMNVYSFGVCLSVSGISLTATRLLSDMPKDRAMTQSEAIIAKCMKVCLFTSVFAGLILFFGADYIAESFLANPKCAVSLKILSPALLGVAISSVLSGYFTAFGMIGSLATGKLFAEITIWGITLWMMQNGSNQIQNTVALATVASSFIQCICDLILWKKSCSSFGRVKTFISTKNVVSLCAPLAVGSYLRTGLGCVENLIIPSRLKAGGINDALAKYGIIKGMSLPVMMFPYVIVGAFTSLIVPEIARRFSSGQTKSVRYISTISIEYIMQFAIMISAILYFWSDELCAVFFKEPDASTYLKYLSLLPVLMFTDSTVDAILKGANEQVYGLKVNIADACARVILIYTLVPFFGTKAYIAVLYLSEFFNLCFSLRKLKKITALKPSKLRAVFVPLFGTFCGVISVNILSADSVWAKIMMFAAVYVGTSETLHCTLKSSVSSCPQ